jgi:hypothetical protein
VNGIEPKRIKDTLFDAGHFDGQTKHLDRDPYRLPLIGSSLITCGL